MFPRRESSICPAKDLQSAGAGRSQVRWCQRREEYRATIISRAKTCLGRWSAIYGGGTVSATDRGTTAKNCFPSYKANRVTNHSGKRFRPADRTLIEQERKGEQRRGNKKEKQEKQHFQITQPISCQEGK